MESQGAKEAGAAYVDLETLLKESDFVSMHVPLLSATFHIINSERWATRCTLPSLARTAFSRTE